jgi:protein-disulfide isomerase
VRVPLAVLALFTGLFSLCLYAPPTLATAPDSPATAVAAPAGTVPAHAFTERVLGKADAPVTLVEYAMLTCPHCAEFHLEAMPKLKKHYIDTGFVRLIYRDYPFDQVSLKAAAVARCVPEESYFPFIEALFFQQGMWLDAKDPVAYLKQLSGFTGLDPATFDACAIDEKLIDHLLKVREAGAQAYQITSTPTLVFDGTIEKMVGAQPFESYVTAINNKLKAAGVEPPSLLETPPEDKKAEPQPLPAQAP